MRHGVCCLLSFPSLPSWCSPGCDCDEAQDTSSTMSRWTLPECLLALANCHWANSRTDVPSVLMQSSGCPFNYGKQPGRASLSKRLCIW